MLYPVLSYYLAFLNLLTAGLQKTYVFFVYAIVFLITFLLSLVYNNSRSIHQILVYFHSTFVGIAIGLHFIYGKGVLDYILVAAQVLLMMILSYCVQAQKETPSAEGVSFFFRGTSECVTLG